MFILEGAEHPQFQLKNKLINHFVTVNALYVPPIVQGSGVTTPCLGPLGQWDHHKIYIGVFSYPLDWDLEK